MSKLLSVVVMLFSLGMALALDKVMDFLRTQYLHDFNIVPLLLGGMFINLLFAASLILLCWLVLARFDKSLLVSVFFILAGLALVFFFPILGSNLRLLKGLPGLTLLVDAMQFFFGAGARSYFAIFNAVVLGIGLAGLFRRGRAKPA